MARGRASWADMGYSSTTVSRRGSGLVEGSGGFGEEETGQVVGREGSGQVEGRESSRGSGGEVEASSPEGRLQDYKQVTISLPDQVDHVKPNLRVKCFSKYFFLAYY